MSTTIYLVRHGHVHNPQNVFYGRLPGFQLSKQGKEEAKKLGNHLRDKPLMAIYTSPMKRTQETARFIQSHHPHISVHTDERLIEVRSPTQGQPFDTLAESHYDFYKKEHIDKGGERMEDIWTRMQNFLHEAAQKHEGQEIAVVSHGDPIMITRTMVSGKPLVFEALRGDGYVQTAQGIVLKSDGSALQIARLAVY